MATPTSVIDKAYRDRLRKTRFRQVSAVMGILGAAAGAIFWVNHNTERQMECAIESRENMIVWVQGKTISELPSYVGLREMMDAYYQECME